MSKVWLYVVGGIGAYISIGILVACTIAHHPIVAIFVWPLTVLQRVLGR